MLRLVLPNWFLGPDVIIDFFSFVVLFVFALMSLKYYRISKNRKFVFLGVAFLLVGIGELSKIIMNIGLYYDFTTVYQIGRLIITSQVVKSIDAVYYVGFFLYRFLVMFGFYLLYYTTKKNKSGLEHLFIIYFIIISAVFTENIEYLFNLTIIVFILFLLINYIKIYKETKAKNTKILVYAFIILLISYGMMIFVNLDSRIYIIANFMELISYVFLLYLMIRIYRHKEDRRKKIQI